VSYRQRLDDAFKILQEKSAPAVAIVDAGGRLIGLVTSETIGEMMMVREAMPKGATFGPWGPIPKT
jgi:CBS domain containing-hemolysin-like protein